MTPQKAKGEGDRAGTRERILDIALDLFIDQGYDKTSLREIAERLGFTKAAIYYHFASKDDILFALHLRLHELMGFLYDGLTETDGMAGWEVVFVQLVDLMFANRRLFILHERNRAALETLHHEEHAGANEELEDRFRRLLRDPAASPRDRVRFSSAIGALMSAMLFLGDIDEEETAIYADQLKQVVGDLLGG